MADTLYTTTAGIGKLLAGTEVLFKEISQVQNLLLSMGWTPPDGLTDIGLGAIQFTELLNKLEIVLASTAEEKKDTVLMAERLSELGIELARFANAIFQLAQNLPTVLSSFGDFADKTNIATEFPKRFFNFWITTYLSATSQPLFSLLRLLNIIEYKQFEENPSEFQAFHVRPIIYYDGILSFLKDPAEHFKQVYGWGTSEFLVLDLLYRISALLESIGVKAAMRPLRPEMHAVISGQPIPADAKTSLQLQLTFYEQLAEIAGIKTGVSIFGLDPTTPGGINGGIAILPMIRGSANGEFPIFGFEDCFISFSIDAELAKRIALLLRPGEGLQVQKAISLTDIIEGSATLGIRNGTTDKPPRTILSFPGGFEIQFQTLSITAGMENSSDKPAEIFFELAIQGGHAGISLNQADGFIKSSTKQNQIDGQFDLTIGWNSSHGIYFRGSAALELSIPAHSQLGPFRLDYLHIGISPAADTLKLNLSASGNLQLGPLTIVIDRLGVRLNIGFDGGNLGLFDLSPSFKPPEAIGIVIDSGGFKGGGFLKFDQPNAEYFGALELEFKELFSLKAFGIINTRMPDGSKGFSLLIIITAEFTPIQLGFGFTLIGVGGLLGLNRTVRLDVLKEGIRTNALKSILFPEDIVANINRIVSDVKAVFPVQEDHFVICPMGKLGWGTPAIITLELGILVEIPVAGFAILGVLKALLPEEEAPLLKLQINFLGVADFDNRSFSFDGTLFDSRLLVYTLTGDMAFRLSYGDHPVFVLSVGGFHPAFKEAPADLQHMQRLSITLFNSDDAWIKVQTYFAVTSNTVQFGARAELFAGSMSGWNIYGFLGYDVLFQFDPFRFLADFSAGFALRRKTSVIMGVTASGELQGPSPWDAHGTASVSFFFFSVSVSFHKSWGESVTAPEQATADLLDMMRQEIMDDRNWKADIPANNKLHVSIKQITSDKIIVHPFGMLTFSERLLPLNINLEKFGNQRPKDVNHFEVKTPDQDLSITEAREPFAPANFFTLSDVDKLARPSYEPMQSGFKITGSKAIDLPMPVSRPVDYELSYLGAKRTKLKRYGPYPFDRKTMKAAMKGGSSASSRLSALNNRISVNAPEKVNTQEDRFAIASVSDMTLFGNHPIAKTYTEAVDHYNRLVDRDPALAEQIQVVAEYEVNVD